MCKTISSFLCRVRAAIPVTKSTASAGPNAAVAALRRILPYLQTRVSNGTAPLEVGQLLADYSCLALQLDEGIEKEVKVVRDYRVPTLQQVAYFQKLTAHQKAVSLANMLLDHVAALSVHISPSSEGHPALLDTWQTVVEILNMRADEEVAKDRDLSRVVMDKCVRWGLRDPLQHMVIECEVLAKKSVNFNMPRVYRVSGWLVRHANTMLHSSSLNSLHKLVTPRNGFGDDWKPKVEELGSLSLALPDYLRGLASLQDFLSNKTAQRFLEEILKVYIKVPEWPADSRHPFAFLLTTEMEEDVREVVLLKLLNLAMEGSKLKKNWGVTNSVLKLIRLSVANRLVMVQVHTIFFPFLLELVARNDSLAGDVKNPRQCAQNLLSVFVKQDSSSVLDFLKEHIVKELHGDYQRKFNILAGFVKMKPELGRPLIKPLQKEVDRINKQSGGFPDPKLKNHLITFEDSVYHGLGSGIQSNKF